MHQLGCKHLVAVGRSASPRRALEGVIGSTISRLKVLAARYHPGTVLRGALGVPCIRNPLHAELNPPPEDEMVSGRTLVRSMLKAGSRSGGTP